MPKDHTEPKHHEHAPAHHVSTHEVAPPTPPAQAAATPDLAPAYGQQEGNGLAIAALIVGIIAFLSGLLPFWGFLAGTTAVILGAIALRKPELKGLAITGIVTGGLAVLTNIVATALFVLSILALGASGSVVDQAIKEANSETKTQVQAKKDFSKGETAKFENLEVKINSVERNFTPESSFSGAPEGKEYIVLNLTIKNVGEQSQYVSTYTFGLDDGGMVKNASFYDKEPRLEGGTLNADGSITGNIVYEVTKDASDLKLQYETTVYDLEASESKELIYTLAI